VSQFLGFLTTAWSAFADYFSFDTALLADPTIVARLLLQVVLLCGSAFFSGSETALFSLSRLDLQKLRRQRHRNSETVHELLDHPRRLIISILCGNELVNIASAINLTAILVTLYGVERAGVISVIVMLPLILLFGEVTPKTIAVTNPVRFGAGFVAAPLSMWVKLITPLRLVIRNVADRLTTWIVGENPAPENILRIDEFRTLVEEVAKGGELSATERALIHHLLDAGDTEVVEIMTPRTRMEFINATTPVPEILERVRQIRHSRVPIFSIHRDNLIGFVHAEDVLRLVLDDMDLRLLNVDDVVHPAVVVPPTKKVDEMFEFFQKRQCRAAVVLNEFGGVEGFVTITDVLNFIFGQIAGRVKGEELHRDQDLDDYEVPGDMKLVDFNNLTNFGLEDPRMTTIAGVAFRHLDGLPKVGDLIVIDDLELTVLEMESHRIARLRVRRVTRPAEVEGPWPDEDAGEVAERLSSATVDSTPQATDAFSPVSEEDGQEIGPEHRREVKS
jgi:CBS domain containing-hemolysin-like protein